MSVVYFIACAGRIKIGITTNLKSRVRALRTHSPDALEIIATVPGAREVEARLHAKLHAHRTCGEWFTDCPEVREAISSIVTERSGTYAPDVNAKTRPLKAPLAYVDERDNEEFERFLSATEMLSSTMKDITERFGALIDSSIFEDFRHARQLESKLRLKPGAILKKVFICQDPSAVHIGTLRTIERCHDKWSEVSDAMTLAIIKGESEGATALCHAAECLIEEAEAAHAKLKSFHQPAVNSIFASPGSFAG